MGTPRGERYERASVRVATRREDVASETTTSDAMIPRFIDRKTENARETPNLRQDAFGLI